MNKMPWLNKPGEQHDPATSLSMRTPKDTKETIASLTLGRYSMEKGTSKLGSAQLVLGFDIGQNKETDYAWKR